MYIYKKTNKGNTFR